MTGPQSPPLDPQTRAGMVEVLEAAAARLRDRGWQRGAYGPPEGPNCIAGAVYWAAAQEGLEEWAGLEAQAALVSHLGCGPTAWNDCACPDGAAAIDALLMTAKEVAGAGETAANGGEGPQGAPKAAGGPTTAPYPPGAV